MRDPYEVLGIQRGASEDEIKKAYRAKCKRWHPDLNPNDPTAEEHFKEVQAAYDAITKGETGPQMGGGYGGAYGQQSGPSYGGYQQGYQQNGYSNGDFGDFGFGYDPFGFGFGFGGNYQQQRGPGYNGADTPEMQAARNFIVNQRYPEARRVLDGITVRTARWYYLSSLANQGLGNSIDALQDARRAVAMARLAPQPALRASAEAYATLVRGVPELVLMLLVFYGGQGLVGGALEALGLPPVEIDQFMAGVFTLGFIYGAYLSETFRGALLGVPPGQWEAGLAYGMGRGRVFWRLILPQAARLALPGLTNNWLVLLKSTALVSIIGLSDLVKAAQNAGKSTSEPLYFLILAGLVYLVITTLSNRIFKRLERRYNLGIKGMAR